MLTNQQEIARHLNISRTTVSRSLANHPAISPETRAQVLEAAKKLGYTGGVGRTKRGRRKGAKFTVGVLVGINQAEIPLATVPYILNGIRDRAEVDHATVDIHYVDPVAFRAGDSLRGIFRQIRNANWRGALLVYPFPHDAVAEFARKISTVTVLDDYPKLGLDSIDVDDTAGIVRLVEHLVESGHRKIGFVAWRYPVGVHWTARRFGAYAEAMYTAGLELKRDWVLNIHKDSPTLTEPEVAKTVAKLTRDQGVTAWVCAADHEAYPLIRDLQHLGVSVPKDCSVTGFDGIAPPLGSPRLTSMGAAHSDIGSSAIARLHGRILFPNTPRRKILVETSLIEGETVRAIR
jgi:LacI family transcriptional regulator